MTDVGTLIDLKDVLMAAAPAVTTMLFFAAYCTYKRGMIEINFPSTKHSIVSIPLDLFIAALALAGGLARHSKLHIGIGIGALSYYLMNQLQIFVAIPRESALFMLELRLADEAKRHGLSEEEANDIFEDNVRACCPNLPGWQKQRIKKKFAKETEKERKP